MENKELIITTAKDILIKAMDSKVNLNLSVRGGKDTVDDLGDRLKDLTGKVSEALHGLE